VTAESTPESPRDMEESAFTPILRGLMRTVPGITAVVFVDGQGECIDYCSALPPFDAKVIAAHMLVVTMSARETSVARAGEPWFVHVHGSERDVLVRRLGDDYALVVVSGSNTLTPLLQESVERAVRELRVEGGMRAPAWEPPTERVRVEVRHSTTGWAYAPKAYWHRGDRVLVTVVGRWIESDASVADDPARDAVCFMVRTEAGQDLTLVHRVTDDVWEVR